MNVVQCRLCLCQIEDQNQKLSPCKCDGTNKYVHKQCLKMSIQHALQTNIGSADKCNICNTYYINQFDSKCRVCSLQQLICQNMCFVIFTVIWTVVCVIYIKTMRDDQNYFNWALVGFLCILGSKLIVHLICDCQVTRYCKQKIIVNLL